LTRQPEKAGIWMEGKGFQKTGRQRCDVDGETKGLRGSLEEGGRHGEVCKMIDRGDVEGEGREWGICKAREAEGGSIRGGLKKNSRRGVPGKKGLRKKKVKGMGRSREKRGER